MRPKVNFIPVTDLNTKWSVREYSYPKEKVAKRKASQALNCSHV